MTELKPCPFCGGEGAVILREDGMDFEYDVGCGTDGCYLEFGAEWKLTKKNSFAPP